jgi:hypothetical protein
MAGDAALGDGPKTVAGGGIDDGQALLALLSDQQAALLQSRGNRQGKNDEEEQQWADQTIWTAQEPPRNTGRLYPHGRLGARSTLLACCPQDPDSCGCHGS